MANQPIKAFVNQPGTPPSLIAWHGRVPIRPPVAGTGGTPGVSPPYLGGFNASGQFSGLMAALAQGAQVLVLYEGDGATGGMYPSGSVSMTDTPNKLPNLPAGDVAIYGPRGDILSHATATGQIVLYQNAGNTLSVTVDPTTNRVNITASGGLYVNGTQVTVP